ncbi:MAG: hypothetical protein GY772_27285 [bacterium]|jgi:hypothetical protein|nr:hypothetical protein [Deltaproteobacteria bacterium]MCP4244266.1 hypothetical protein [bacterium]
MQRAAFPALLASNATGLRDAPRAFPEFDRHRLLGTGPPDDPEGATRRNRCRNRLGIELRIGVRAGVKGVSGAQAVGLGRATGSVPSRSRN